MSKADSWVESPQTGQKMVIQDFDDKNGVSKVDISTGFYTNEYPLNYKKHPKFNIKKYEKKMPRVMVDMRFDDGESYWYPSILRTESDMLFPANVDGKIKWCYAPIKKEMSGNYNDLSFESIVDMSKAEYFEKYIDAAKKVRGYSLGDI